MRDQTYQVISIHDASIDFEATSPDELASYAITREESKLRFKPGKAPLRFHYKRLRQRQLVDYVERGTSDADKAYRSFACAVFEVHNYKDGVWRPLNSDRPNYYAMTEAEMELFEWAHIMEVGAVIYARSTLPLEFALDSPPLPLSARVLQARTRSLPAAEPSETSAAPSKSKRKGD